MQPAHVVGQTVDADDHGGRHASWFQEPTPLRETLAVAGEHDRFGLGCGNVGRDLAALVVVGQRLRYESSALLTAAGRVVIHRGLASSSVGTSVT